MHFSSRDPASLARIMARTAAAVCVFTGPDLAYEYVNEEYVRIVGHREYLGRPVREVLEELNDDGILSILEEVYRSGVPFNGKEVPLELHNDQGELRIGYYNLHFEPDRGPNGEVLGVILTGVDVSEQVLSRQALEKAHLAVENERENFRNLFRQTPEMVCIMHGPDHVFEFVNEAHVEVLGFNATGMAVREAQPESVEVHGILDEVYRTGVTAELFEIPITVTDRLRYFNLTYAARRDLQGEINGIMILGIEVSDAVKTRESLEGNRQQLKIQAEWMENVLNQLPVGVMLVEPESGLLQFANPSAQRMLGGAKPRLSDYDLTLVRALDDQGEALSLDQYPRARAARGEKLTQLEFNWQTPTGLRHLLVDSERLPPLAGRTDSILLSLVDITDLKRVEAELVRTKDAAESASRMKSAFLANMSHEIRTPLGAILGFTELLKERELDESDRQAYLEVISRNGEGLTAIINDVLDLSKIEAGQLTVETLEVSPRALLEEVLSSLSVKAREKKLKLTGEVDPEVPEMVGTDAVRFRQILFNLVGNALKFTTHGGVKCRVSWQAGCLITEVSDSGIGMDEEQQGRIFQAFSQADESTTRKFGGTGLGLALSKKLAEALGGDVELVQSRIGLGSVFRVTVEDRMDAAAAKAGRLTTSVSQPRKIDLDGLQVLVVEDSPDNQNLIWRILTRREAAVTIAANGLEGVHKAFYGDFDVVIMDMQMPTMDGYTATQTLRGRGYDRPIIALTAHAMSDVQQRCLEIGCDDYLSKPIQAEVLVAKVADLGRRRNPRVPAAD